MPTTPQPRILDLSNPADRALARRTIRFAWRFAHSTLLVVLGYVALGAAAAFALPAAPWWVYVLFVAVPGAAVWLAFPVIVAWVATQSRPGRRIYALQTESTTSVVVADPAAYGWAPASAVKLSNFASRPKRRGAGRRLAAHVRRQELAAGRSIAAYALGPLSRVYARNEFPAVGRPMPGIFRHLTTPDDLARDASGG